jgi:hypothetical protein
MIITEIDMLWVIAPLSDKLYIQPSVYNGVYEHQAKTRMFKGCEARSDALQNKLPALGNHWVIGYWRVFITM